MNVAPVITQPKGLLDLPVEALACIASHADQPSLAAFAQTCSHLCALALPVLWHTLALDLSGSGDEDNESHVHSTMRTERILTNVSKGMVGKQALACVKKVSICVGERTTNELLQFVGRFLINGNLLINAREVEISGASWTNVETVKSVLLGGFMATPSSSISFSIHDVSLSTLIELVMPQWQGNLQITSLGVILTTANHTEDIVLLGKVLRHLANLKCFSLSFSDDFDLVDHTLMDHIADLFAGLDKKLQKVKVLDYPPYLSFNPAWLSRSVREFVFHTNEIDCETIFTQALLQQCAQLTSLSVRIAQSIDPEPPLAVPYGDIQLCHLRKLVFDTPTAHVYLPSFLSANRRLRHLSVSNMSTAALISLFQVPNLTHLCIYSFAATSSCATLAELTIKSAHKHFKSLRLLMLPELNPSDLAICASIASLFSHLPIIIPTHDSISATRDSSAYPYSPAPSPFQAAGAFTTPPKTMRNARPSLWASLPFINVEELDLFCYYTAGLDLVVL